MIMLGAADDAETRCQPISARLPLPNSLDRAAA